MAAPVTFRRIYRDHGPDLEHPCQPGTVDAVLRVMNAAGAISPFIVAFSMDDGATVIAKPRRAR